MNDAIDKLLRARLLEPPDGFDERVMARIRMRSVASASDPKPDSGGGRELVEWLALAGAVIAGSAQLVGLLFGIFVVTTAA